MTVTDWRWVSKVKIHPTLFSVIIQFELKIENLKKTNCFRSHRAWPLALVARRYFFPSPARRLTACTALVQGICVLLCQHGEQEVVRAMCYINNSI